MEYVRLGKTDLLISRVAFGAMKLTETGSDEDVAQLVRNKDGIPLLLLAQERIPAFLSLCRQEGKCCDGYGQYLFNHKLPASEK